MGTNIWLARRLAGASILTLVLSGCTKTHEEAGTIYWGSSNPMVTTASVRTILQRPSNFDQATGLNRPSTIVCAEPSPDVALAVGESFGGSIAADLKEGLGSPTGATPAQVAVAAAISSSHAEAVAQLGERLVTIQLLRDGLYRACEVFANGAISASTYSVMVGRIDDLVVTLLAEEMAAGAFGRSLAGASTGAASSGMATLARNANEQVQQKLAELKAAEAKENEAKLKVTQAQTATPKPSDAEMQQLRSEEKQATEARQKAQGELNAAGEDLNIALSAHADSQAWGAVTAGGKIEGRGAPSSADQSAIAAIQAKYIDDQGIDSLTIACMSELSRMRDDGKTPIMAGASGPIYAGPISALGRSCLNVAPQFLQLVGLGLLRQMDAGPEHVNMLNALLRSHGGKAPAPVEVLAPIGPTTSTAAIEP